VGDRAQRSRRPVPHGGAGRGARRRAVAAAEGTDEELVVCPLPAHYLVRPGRPARSTGSRRLRPRPTPPWPMIGAVYGQSRQIIRPAAPGPGGRGGDQGVLLTLVSASTSPPKSQV